ncbi:MAG: hypothetical protein KGN84_01040 [Acidobacteriota bacterium]|nr:hypothetical protein [Acidobacteriota bacterium]
MASFHVGLDLGQRNDPAAIAIIERVAAPRAGMRLRYVERAPLGTPYPQVVEWVRKIVRTEPLESRCDLAVDATGVGGPVVDLLKRADLNCDVLAVTITGGDAEGQTASGHSVPKLDLMTGLQVALENGDLVIARAIRDREALIRELIDVQARRRASGRLRIGADGEGQHDDLVIAVALALWVAKKGRRNWRTYQGGSYLRPEQYDPVLRFHCRLDEPRR